MMAYRRSRYTGMAEIILNLGTRRKHQALNSRYTLRGRLVGPQSRTGRCGEVKDVLPLPVIETQVVQVDIVKDIALFLCLIKHHSMMSGGSS